MDVTLKLRLETVREIERISPVRRKTRQTRQAGSLSYELPDRVDVTLSACHRPG